MLILRWFVFWRGEIRFQIVFHKDRTFFSNYVQVKVMYVKGSAYVCTISKVCLKIILINLQMFAKQKTDCYVHLTTIAPELPGAKLKSSPIFPKVAHKLATEKPCHQELSKIAYLSTLNSPHKKLHKSSYSYTTIFNLKVC